MGFATHGIQQQGWQISQLPQQSAKALSVVLFFFAVNEKGRLKSDGLRDVYRLRLFRNRNVLLQSDHAGTNHLYRHHILADG